MSQAPDPRDAKTARASVSGLAPCSSTDLFNELYARMQAPGVAERTIAALDLRKKATSEVSSPRAAKPRSRRSR